MYVPEAVVDPLIEVIVTVRSVVPVSRVMTRFPSASVTASLNVTVTLISSPALYLPSAVVDVIDEMVGTVVSIISALFAPREFVSPGGTIVK